MTERKETTVKANLTAVEELRLRAERAWTLATVLRIRVLDLTKLAERADAYAHHADESRGCFISARNRLDEFEEVLRLVEDTIRRYREGRPQEFEEGR